MKALIAILLLCFLSACSKQKMAGPASKAQSEVARAVEQALKDSEQGSSLKGRFTEIHHQLRQDASERAVDAIVALLKEKGRPVVTESV
mgnify:CR=1 FL=1